MNIDEILYQVKEGSNLRCGYQTADIRGYLQISSVILSATVVHLKGFLVLVLAWKTAAALGLVVP